MTRVVLIRPGATSYDEQDRIQGVLDLPLSERGRREADLLAARLGEVQLAALYHGPGEGLHETAEVIGKALQLRPKKVPELRNLDHGLWQGLVKDEFRRRNPKVYRQWRDDPLTVCPPEGEPVAAAMGRVRAALRSLLRRHREETVGLVVAEPLAQLVSCHLRSDAHVQLDDDVPTGDFERIDVVAGPQRGGRIDWAAP